jgi:hypothetical protein
LRLPFGDDLCERYTWWREVDRFVLLCGAVICTWRESTLLFNQIGTRRDEFGLGASAAFSTSNVASTPLALLLPRPIPNLAPFLQSTCSSRLDARSRRLRVRGTRSLAFRLLRSALPNVCIERAANASALAAASLPYLAAVWAPAASARSLFWAADRLQQGRVAVLCEVLKWLHRKRLDVRLPAVVVHALAARYGLIAQITFGETGSLGWSFTLSVVCAIARTDCKY